MNEPGERSTELTGAEKRRLRAIGQKLKVSCIVGRAGATDTAIAAVRRQLLSRELVKIRIPAGPANDRKTLARQIARATGSICVSVLGRTALLARSDRPADAGDDRDQP